MRPPAATTPAPGTITRSRRFDSVDVARGIALAAMIVYHGAWDLWHFRLSPIDVVANPYWRAFARVIAGSFLLLVGVSLVLAHGRGIRWRPFLRRMAMIVAAALAITAVTWVATPDAPIYFGILHSIALASLIALPFLRAPAWLAAVVAAAVLVLPFHFRTAALDPPVFLWIGLSARVPLTNDYVPVFPWFGLVLAGVLLGRLAMRHAPDGAWTRWQAVDPVSATLAAAGRRSLLVYLLHQPVLYGLAFLLFFVFGPSISAERTLYRQSCVSQCEESGAASEVCRSACTCVTERLDRETLARALDPGGLSDVEREKTMATLNDLVGQCIGTPQRP